MTSDNRRQFVKYTFFKADSTWRRLGSQEKERGKDEFASVLEEFSSSMVLNSYSLVGTRGDVDFMLWKISPSLELLEDMIGSINRTTLGGHLTIPYSYLALTHPSPYVDAHTHLGHENLTGAMKPIGKPYMFIYPFVKSHQWYQLPKAARQRMMDEHFTIGHRYPSVKIHTSYSFGLDDQEFVLGFEGDRPSDFLELVMELRHQEQRPYTLRDTPIFTCVLNPLRQCLDYLG